ncbi:6-phosphofructokinase [Lacrimispora amygdalina]|uniref:Pyrophosphate--fructose 6-phosphate 1-phosphotransferase n=1 Tax=Lacrimispora amygdalina TaxID=253257 RepID=A0A3E2N651_9FIRM|nr:6-phosphofructokinase [Clostridium indicum]RFZ76477.1 6-phosphofructokinase [Clostridium indicum]
MKNLLIAQSGGPTAVINSSLAGVAEAACVSSRVDGILGAFYGIQGVLNERFVDLKKVLKSSKESSLLCQTPASLLGSCRYSLKPWRENEEEYEKLVGILRKHHISYFIYIGGNDSMDTVFKMSEYLKEKEIEDILIAGVPKTIDNDLEGTDHCPGFGSAAKYVAATVAELERDISVYPVPGVTIVEIMGRNAGWLAAASALSRINGGPGPELIYLCETSFSMERFLVDMKRVMARKKSFLIAVSEGLKDEYGCYISEQVQTAQTDAFGHKYISGAGKILENLIRSRLDCKVRTVELNLMQRCAAHIASETDLKEAWMLGGKALQCVLDGKNGEMASIRRLSSDPYIVEYTSVYSGEAANREKKVPGEMISGSGCDVNEKMIEYLRPLIQGERSVKYENGIPAHLILEESLAGSMA